MLASATVSPKGMPPPKGRVALVLSPLPLSPRPERALGLLGGTTPHPRSHPRRSSVTPTTSPGCATHVIHVSKGSD